MRETGILNQVRLPDQHSDFELGSPPDRMYSLLHPGTGSGTSPSASADLAMQGEAPDMPPPVLAKYKPFPFPAVGIVERPVSGSGTSPSASAGVAMQGEAPDMPPPVLSEAVPFPAVDFVDRSVSGSAIPETARPR